MRLFLASIAVLACGCRFDVAGLVPVGSAGDASVDAASVDGAMPDASPGVVFAPSHVGPAEVAEGAASLSGMVDIDTDALTIDQRPPPPGVLFTPATENAAWAVLEVHDFTVTSDVRVHGARALVVVAVGTIEVDAMVHAEAAQRTPGPGGDYTGMGVGSDGKSAGGDDSGGGGAGHASTGAKGGDSTAKNNGQGGAGGSAYGSTNDLVGGSGGGSGSGATSTQHPCPAGTWSVGGAGGGSIQLSAKLQLRVSATGGINAGGGGGAGGCAASASAGGGGGSGGTIWLEAPTMTIEGKVAANGGGGGSGGDGGPSGADGMDGNDGLLAVAVATGGTSSGSSSGAGGAGGASTTSPTTGTQATNAGGGGGAVGTVRIRTHAVSPVTGSSTVLSPAPLASVDF